MRSSGASSRSDFAVWSIRSNFPRLSRLLQWPRLLKHIVLDGCRRRPVMASSEMHHSCRSRFRCFFFPVTHRVAMDHFSDEILTLSIWFFPSLHYPLAAGKCFRIIVTLIWCWLGSFFRRIYITNKVECLNWQRMMTTRIDWMKCEKDVTSRLSFIRYSRLHF